jgi:hypothetical protein
MQEFSLIRLRNVRIGLVLLVISALLFFAGCTNSSGTSAPEIALKVDQKTVANGDEVTLTAEVLKGTVTSVTFKADKGAAIPPVTTPNQAGDFVAKVQVTQTTTFTAEATGPEGTSKATPATKATVTVTSEPPEAPAQTFTAYKDVSLLVGITPTDFAATSDLTVEGVKGNVEAVTDQATAKGGKVTIEAGSNALAFNYRPAKSFTGTDSFDYTVSGNGETKTGTITLTVKNLPTNVTLLSTLANIGETQIVNQTIVLTKTIACASSPCISLLEGQTLTGKAVTTDGITLVSPTAGILANIPGTRQPGTASGQGAETRVIELADGSSVKNLTIDGSGEKYFVAIFGTTYDDGSTRLEGNINIEDVVIKNSNGKPIYLKCQAPACDPNILYGEYNLTINNLRIESAFDTVVIGSPGTLSFTNSVIELKPPFGDNVGIDIVDTIGASLTLDNVDVFMETTDYILDGNANTDGNGKPFIITSNKPGATTTLTVKNCDITYGDSVNLSSVITFKLQANNATISIVNSTGNTSEATNPSIQPTITGTGAINGTLELQ